MKFFAYFCECGYVEASPSVNPKCPDCGKDLIKAEKGTEKYQEIDRAIRQKLGMRI